MLKNLFKCSIAGANIFLFQTTEYWKECKTHCKSTTCQSSLGGSQHRKGWMKSNMAIYIQSLECWAQRQLLGRWDANFSLEFALNVLLQGTAKPLPAVIDKVHGRMQGTGVLQALPGPLNSSGDAYSRSRSCVQGYPWGSRHSWCCSASLTVASEELGVLDLTPCCMRI